MITEEQRLARRNWLGASDIARAITGKFGGLHAVILSKRGEPQVAQPPSATDTDLLIEHGNWSEGPGLDWFEEQHDAALLRGLTVRAAESRNIRLSVNLDGMIPNASIVIPLFDAPQQCIGIPVEHKYVTPHTEHEWTREQPNDYTLIQTHTQMLCCEADHAWVVVTLYWKDRFAIRVPRNDALCQSIDNYARWLWETYCAPAEMPSMDFAALPDTVSHQQLREALNATKIIQGSVIQLDERDQRTVQLMDAAREAGNAFTRGADALRDWMALRMGECETGALPDGSVLTRKLRSRKGYTVEPAEYIEMKHTEPKAKG